MIPTPPVLIATHEVLNQAHALENYNAYTSNLALQEAVAQQGAGWAHYWLSARGAVARSLGLPHVTPIGELSAQVARAATEARLAPR